MAITGGGLALLDIQLPEPLQNGSVTLALGGLALPPPSATLLLGDPELPRLIHASRWHGLLLPGTMGSLRAADHAPIAFVVPDPCEPAAFADGFTSSEREALLRFLAATCAPMLRAADDIGLAALCHALIDAADTSACLAAPSNGLSAWAVPPAPPGIWRRLSATGLAVAGRPAGRVMLLDGDASAGDVLLPPAPSRPVRLVARHPGRTLAAAVRDTLGGRGSDLLRALAARAARDDRAAALLREAQLFAPTRPTRVADPAMPIGAGFELALSDHAGGVFLCGWLRDPLRLVASMELRAPGRSLALPPERLHRLPRPDLHEKFARAPLGRGSDLPGFVAHLPGIDPAGTAQWRIALRLAGGAELEMAAPPGLMPAEIARDLVLRAAHPSAVSPALLDDCITPAAAALHAAARRAPTPPPEVVAFGPPAPARSRASLIVPLYRNLRFLRFQLAALARDPATHRSDLIYVLDSPEQRHEVEHLLRGMAGMLGQPVRLVVMPRNLGYAAACNAGAARARAPALVFLNSDVLPATPGWLERMLRRLGGGRRIGAVGPRLLFEDGSIQHAGLLFRLGDDGVWLNDHYFKGFPRHHRDALRARAVPAVTGAAILVRRAAFERAEGFCTDYIVGDFEDSDLCLKLRAGGHEIAYEPAAELFHFERQSIALHHGHARTLAGAVNRRLHHRRWGDTIAALMPRFGSA